MFVAQIFGSFHGEVNGHHQGRMVTFIRLSGCNLRCPYCDTKDTWNQLYGENLSIFQILDKVKEIGNDYVCLTGGEPLLDYNIVRDLLAVLHEQGYHISVETNGTVSVSGLFKYVESFVIDYKMHLVVAYPTEAKRIKSNFAGLRNTDVIKFLIATEAELHQAKFIMENIITENRKSHSNPIFAFSPLLPEMTPSILAELLIKYKIRNSVLSLQIHKFVGFD